MGGHLPRPERAELFASVCVGKRMPFPRVAELLGHTNSITGELAHWHLLQGSTASDRSLLHEAHRELDLSVMAACWRFTPGQHP
jgi:hypothetical protein